MIDVKCKKNIVQCMGDMWGPKKIIFFTKRKRNNNIYKNNNTGIKRKNNHCTHYVTQRATQQSMCLIVQEIQKTEKHQK